MEQLENVHVRAFIDERALSRQQLYVMVLLVLIVAFDGMDIGIMGFVAPEIIRTSGYIQSADGYGIEFSFRWNGCRSGCHGTDGRSVRAQTFDSRQRFMVWPDDVVDRVDNRPSKFGRYARSSRHWSWRSCTECIGTDGEVCPSAEAFANAHDCFQRLYRRKHGCGIFSDVDDSELWLEGDGRRRWLAAGCFRRRARQLAARVRCVSCSQASYGEHSRHLRKD